MMTIRTHHRKHIRHSHQSQKAPHPSEVITQILPGNEERGSLFISGLEGAKNLKQLSLRKIYTILTVGSDIADTTFPSTFSHKVIKILDFPDQDIKEFFKEAITFIHQAILQRKNILIHCYIGISRSVTIAIAYILTHYEISLIDAFKHVQTLRPLINPNEGFLRQLHEFYQLIQQIKSTSDNQQESADSEIQLRSDVINNKQEQKHTKLTKSKKTTTNQGRAQSAINTPEHKKNPETLQVIAGKALATPAAMFSRERRVSAVQNKIDCI